MKKSNLIILLAIFLGSFIFESCGGEKKESSTQNAKETSSNEEVVKNPVEEEKIEPANLTCRLYFKSNDMEDEDGNISKGDIGERDEFRTKKAYTFCYDSESFSSLKIEGSGKRISIAIKEGNKEIYKKENIDIEGAFVISTKDAMIQGGNLKYTISITQEENNIFLGKIDSQGCM
jgi:hypothetical protein